MFRGFVRQAPSRCLCVMLVIAAGCGDSGPSRDMGKVSGKVTYKGGALPAGAAKSRVVFEHEEGPVQVANIAPDGTYSAEVAVGENRIKVEHAEDMVYPTEGRTGMPMPGKNLIPRKYNHVETSGLKLKVESGEQTFDIDMTGEVEN